MFDDEKTAQQLPKPQEAADDGARLIGHPMMDKPTALESGRLQEAQSAPTLAQADIASPPAPPLASAATVELASPLLVPKKPHHLRLVILLIVVVAVLGAVGAWVYVLNRTASPTQDPFAPEQNAPTAEQADADADRDGLTDTQERRLGTDPQNPDTDGDGLTDKEEAELWNTNPLVADTDGDGFKDGEEVDNGYNPAGPGKLFAIDDIDL